GSVDENGALIRPLYPFGHGLSYTEFSYSKLTISPAEISPDGMVRLSLDVTNKGKRRGVETVQLYLRDPLASVSRPVAELKGFQRVELLPGRSATVTFELPSELVAFFDPAMRLVVEP